MNKPHSSPRLSIAPGFTLVELIAVLVILGIVSSIGSTFIVSTVQSYDQVQQRSKLINRGRVAIEQMTRQIRIALPNSVRVSASGNCLEFMPLVAGAVYLQNVPDNANLAPTVTSIATAPYSIGFGEANHVSIAALDAAEIYAVGSGLSRVSIGTFGAGPPFTEVPLASAHRFIRNSVNRRVYISDDPRRFCLIGPTLVEYFGYGLDTSAMSDAAPGGASTSTIADNVATSGQAFVLSQGSEDVNTSVTISLDFSLGSNSVTLTQQVLVRNVP